MADNATATEVKDAQSSPRWTTLVEQDARWRSAYGSRKDSAAHALYSALVTLTLGVLGSTILPVPYAFSKTGITVGCLTMLLVAFVNDSTCVMLIRAAAHTGLESYEQLAEWAGGHRAKRITQVSLLLLLYGTLCGGMAFLADVSRILVARGMPGPPGSTPSYLQLDGRPVMVVVVATVLYPLCLQRHIREFEKAATVGVVVVVALMAVVTGTAVQRGFPAVASGELPLLELRLDPHLPEAFAVLGFAFYMQPMLMPLVKEMPHGPGGVALTEKAVHITLYAVACGAYGTVGIFGAAIFGSETESNIMVNNVLPSGTPTLCLYGALLLYLCCGMVTTHYALRASLDLLLFGPDAPFTWTRQILETTGVLSAAMAVALTFPTYAEKIFALTGCTAVCLVCYCIPVYIHAAMVQDQRRIAKATATGPEQDQEQHAGDGAPHSNGNGAPSAAAPAAAADVAGDEEEGAAAGCQSSKAAGPSGDGLRAPLLGGAGQDGESGSHRARPRRAAVPRAGRTGVAALWDHWLLPALILTVGVGFSLAGLWVGAMDIYQSYCDGRPAQGP